MTNHELNLALYRAVGDLKKALPDYCNDLNELMPLVFEHRLELTDWYGEAFTAFHPLTGGCVDEDPQRALVKCLIKYLEMWAKCS